AAIDVREQVRVLRPPERVVRHVTEEPDRVGLRPAAVAGRGRPGAMRDADEDRGRRTRRGARRGDRSTTETGGTRHVAPLLRSRTKHRGGWSLAEARVAVGNGLVAPPCNGGEPRRSSAYGAPAGCGGPMCGSPMQARPFPGRGRERCTTRAVPGAAAL